MAAAIFLIAFRLNKVNIHVTDQDSCATIIREHFLELSGEALLRGGGRRRSVHVGGGHVAGIGIIEGGLVEDPVCC